MIASIITPNKTYSFNLKKKVSLSFALDDSIPLPKAFYAPDFSIEAVKTADFIGSTIEGGLVNFKNIFVNPHGNGTHTECVGHIAKESFYINECLQDFFLIAKLITVVPEKIDDDDIITEKQLKAINFPSDCNAIIIRTLPNDKAEKQKDWSGTNPPYLHHKAVQHIVNQGIEHILLDLPSVDREEDEGKLLAHKTFWNYPSNHVRNNCTITEMIYVPNNVKDGLYITHIQIMPVASDASPSNVFIYPIL